MNTKAAMHGGTIDTQEDPVCHRRPCGVLRIAIKAHLPNQTNNVMPNPNQISGYNNASRSETKAKVWIKSKFEKQADKQTERQPCFRAWNGACGTRRFCR